MSVLKQPLATPSRFRGIYRYLLNTKQQQEKKEVFGKMVSPDELVKDKPSERPMFEYSLTEAIKCGLLVEIITEEITEIAINSNLPENVRNKKTGDLKLPNTLSDLFFASNNEDEYDFGLVCAWFLAQYIYDPPNTWEKVEQAVHQQKVDQTLGLKMTNNTLYGQMDDWMCYLGLAWGHGLDKKRILVPDPTVYLKRNLKSLFNETGEKVYLREFISRLAKKCPLFETGHFRDTIEANIGQRETNYLSTSTAFALFRLQDEGYIQLIRESDGDLMLLPKAQNKIDDSSRVSHIIFNGLNKLLIPLSSRT
ncbi:protein DpdG [Crocosphaera sp. UHCC 0190]|uniref:protein DpdG n=1 Tax=unclassified Crocosphaera TaxID=2623705 RepID=UPI002B21541D|nr:MULTISPECIES: protein DpdG [unclassified Crocosphaera]MEA5511955.1 protein DpdG [Crocosphaera sp. UHCC 0190]MEA5536677.1 protein DpdG [Crocosphaera sp. XPORK-15E]